MNRILSIQENLIKKNLNKIEFYDSLKGKTIVITGGSRGIGLAIAKRCARDGANIAILAKSTEENPKIPGTIFSAAKEIEACGGKALPLKCDIRFEDEVKKCIQQVVAKFGGIDIVINNASAIDISNTSDVTMKKSLKKIRSNALHKHKRHLFGD